MFEFTVLPMGVKNGPAVFQRIIMRVLRDHPHACVYIDDVLIVTGPMVHETIVETHFKAVQEVLEAFRKANITAKGSKVHLFMTMIKF